MLRRPPNRIPPETNRSPRPRRTLPKTTQVIGGRRMTTRRQTARAGSNRGRWTSTTEPRTAARPDAVGNPRGAQTGALRQDVAAERPVRVGAGSAVAELHPPAVDQQQPGGRRAGAHRGKMTPASSGTPPAASP